MSGESANRRKGREFGLVVGGAAAVTAGLVGWRGGSTWWWLSLAAVGALLLLLALVAPRALAPPARVWLAFAERLALVGNAVILAAVFFGVVTPVGLAMRLAGQDPLGRRRPRGRSAWVPYAGRRADPRHFERMY